jgi:hypothetical protein
MPTTIDASYHQNGVVSREEEFVQDGQNGTSGGDAADNAARPVGGDDVVGATSFIAGAPSDWMRITSDIKAAVHKIQPGGQCAGATRAQNERPPW